MSAASTDDSSNTSPERELTFEIDERTIAIEISEELYPLDAIYGAAYLFIDRCWLYLGRPADRVVRVELRSKEAAPGDEALETLAGEFANELLNQVMRFRIGESTATIREYYMARAFFGGTNNASIDALLAELDQEELEEGDLEIAVPWAEGTTKDVEEPAEEAVVEDTPLDISVPWEQES